MKFYLDFKYDTNILHKMGELFVNTNAVYLKYPIITDTEHLLCFELSICFSIQEDILGNIIA